MAAPSDSGTTSGALYIRTGIFLHLHLGSTQSEYHHCIESLADDIADLSGGWNGSYCSRKDILDAFHQHYHGLTHYRFSHEY